MNLLLSDDYLLQDYPENITNTIRSGHATCLRFNRRGDYLASGRVDGTVVIWDLDTMGVARKLRGHSKSISSLSWSRCGRYLLSACQGWKAVLWDLKDGKPHRQVRFKAPVYIAELHPWNQLVHRPPQAFYTQAALTRPSFQFVVSLYEEQPLLVDISEPVAHKYVLATAPRRVKVEEDAEKRARQKKDDARHMTTVTIYTKSGDHILAGTNKGNLNIIDARTHEIIYTQLKVCSGVVTTLKLTRSGRELLVNGQDKVIKTFHLPDLSAEDLDSDTIQLPIEHKFEDVVNRCSWNHVTFSCTGEYVVASTYNNHELYIWERGHGSLVRMLEGPKEEQGVIEWHPSKALLAACGLETGRINIWSVTSPQRWSALAPDFVEVEENVEYMEREDEFDIHPQEEIKKRKLDQEDEEVDVMTIGLAGVGDHPGGFEMPILFNLGDSDSEEEFVAVSTGTMRRRSPGDGADASGEATGTEERPGKKTGNRGRARKR